MSRKRAVISSEPVTTEIESMTHEGRGVTHINGKTVFIDGAMPGEVVEFVYTKGGRNFDEGRVSDVLEASEHRVEPACPHFGVCGGCRLQHVAPEEQLRIKQKVLLDNFHHLGQVEPETVLPPLTGPVWGYRRKARLGVRFVAKKERVLVGFREQASKFLADLQTCKVLHPSVGERLLEMGEVIRELSCYTRVPQVEVAVTDDATALVFRHLEPLNDNDRHVLTEFGKRYDYQIYLQPKGPDSVKLLWPEQASLSYELADYDLKLHFSPSDFTQVNHDINPKMVAKALELLALDENDRVLELFCGLGNFTLPMARKAREVVGVEGSAELIARARENAEANSIDNVEYHVANLMESVKGLPWLRKQSYDKVLLDPPRSGAIEVLPHVAASGASRIVYVSCHPATLARDAGELVRKYGYRLSAAGIMDMFPHTAHVESIALFEKI